MKKKIISFVICFLLILTVFATMDIVFNVPSKVNAENGWSDTIRLSELGNDSIEPQVAANGSNVHVVWADNKTGNYEIYYRRSLDNGETWGSETRLTFTSANQTNPKIAVWGNDVHVVWKDGYINSTDNGGSWGLPSNPFATLNTTTGPDIGVYQNNVYITVANYTFHLSDPPGMEEWWHYVLFKEISWADWVILYNNTGDGYNNIIEVAMAVKEDDIHIVFGECFWSITPRLYFHTFSLTGGLPGSWSIPESIAGDLHKAGISISFDEDLVRISWGDWADIGIYTKIWNGTWSNKTYIGFGYGYTSTSGYYIIWDEIPDISNHPLYSNKDGLLINISTLNNELSHDVYLENDNIHLVFVNEYEIYYMRKNGTDLKLTANDITFVPLSPIPYGTEVNIHANISNGGPKPAENMIVKFYNGDPDVDDDLVPDVTANEIGSKIIKVNRYSWNITSLNWTPPSSGFYDIYVWADPDNITEDYNRSNNLAFKTLEVMVSYPSPPRGLRAFLSERNVTLSWNASPDDGSGEDDIAGYTVYKSSTGVNGVYEFTAWIPANDSLSYNWTDFGAGDGNWDDYFYIVRANDTLNKEEQNNNKVGKVVSYLTEGWNLISVPLIQANTSRENVLQTIGNNYSAVMGYHAGKSRPWLGWHRDKPNYFNDEIDINHKGGYYIDMLNPDHLVVVGRVPTNTQIQLEAGWNLVSYPSLTNRTIDDVLSSISGLYTKVYFYNTTSDRDEAIGPSDLMYPGCGYWIHVHTNCVWEVPL